MKIDVQEIQLEQRFMTPFCVNEIKNIGLQTIISGNTVR